MSSEAIKFQTRSYESLCTIKPAIAHTHREYSVRWSRRTDKKETIISCGIFRSSFFFHDYMPNVQLYQKEMHSEVSFDFADCKHTT